jgi:uncharacterized protein with GYD domain
MASLRVRRIGVDDGGPPVPMKGEMQMARYMIEATYTREGMQGVLKEGGSARRDAIGKLMADLGGSLESFHFAFGGTDAFVIVDVPDNVTAAAIGMTVGASGAVSTKTVVLLTPEEIDQATKKSIAYRPPGK